MVMYNLIKNGEIKVPQVDDRHCLSNDCNWLPVVGRTTDEIDGEESTCHTTACAYGILLCEELRQIGRNHSMGTQIVMYNAGAYGDLCLRGSSGGTTLLGYTRGATASRPR